MYKIFRQDIDKKTGRTTPNETFRGRVMGLQFDRGQAIAEQLTGTHLFHLNRWSPRYRVTRLEGNEWVDVDLSAEIKAATGNAEPDPVEGDGNAEPVVANPADAGTVVEAGTVEEIQEKVAEKTEKNSRSKK